MAVTTTATANQVAQWARKYFVEYVRESRFKRYMGTDENSIIQIKHELEKEAGDNITVSLVTRLTGAGVTGDNTLEGNEEALSNYGHKIEIDQLRNAVRVGKMEQKKTLIDYLAAGRAALKNWSKENLRDTIIARMQSPNLDGTETYASCSETEKDAWLDANTDRVLFGAAKSNLTDSGTADHSASLLNIDSSSDVLSPAIVSLAKRMARDADPHIRPVTVAEDEEWFVLFTNKWAFRDLKNHPTFTQAVREGWDRGKDNPLFRDGDLVWDGVIVREIVEIPVISGVGASSIDVAPNFLCGAQSILLAWGSMPEAIDDDFDYKNQRGVGIAEMRGVEKAMYNSKQHGMLTLYTAGVADT